MTIILAGGGSGGHITPLLAVAKELKDARKGVKTVIVTERGGKFRHLLSGHDDSIDETHFIHAGKLRRYFGETWLVRVFDFKRNFLNLRDVFLLFLGFIQSFGLLLKSRPDLVFIKGGYVGVPVGWAARLLRIPYVTHDSDASAGLTNRLIAGGAKVNAVGMPAELYSYPKAKTVFVGVPVGDDFSVSSQDHKDHVRAKLSLDRNSLVILVTGGSNGAQRLDKVVLGVVKDLLESYPNLHIIHQVGQGNENIYKDYPKELQDRIMVKTFLNPLSDYSTAADLVIARGGATAIAEFAAQKKTCIILPNPQLTGGHQLENAKVLSQRNAAVVIQEEKALSDTGYVSNKIKEMLNDQEKCSELANNLHKFIPNDAAKQLAELLLKQVK